MIHAQFHHRVDGLRRADIFLQGKDRFVDHWAQNAVGDKAGQVIGFDRFLAHHFAELQCGLEVSSAGGESADDFDQFHQRHGIHEVHADDFVRDRFVTAAILVIEMDEVLVARITSSRAAASISLKILNFNSGFSVAASMTKSASSSVS